MYIYVIFCVSSQASLAKEKHVISLVCIEFGLVAMSLSKLSSAVNNIPYSQMGSDQEPFDKSRGHRNSYNRNIKWEKHIVLDFLVLLF